MVKEKFVCCPLGSMTGCPFVIATFTASSL